ncbi:sensor histidine kinase [Halobacteriales archaeon Cl-PHB]
MTEEAQSAEDDARTARTVGQLVKYSREVNQSETVEEVGTYALEATFHVMDGHPEPTVVEVRQGDIRVLESMSTTHSAGDSAGPIAEHAHETDGTVILASDDTRVNYTTDDAAVVDPADLGIDPPDAAATLVAPSYHEDDEFGEVGVLLVVQWPQLDAVEQWHVKPVEYLADHVATAINNIRSRERLERARNDLVTRKEMIEMYDRLLRHDLANDLQVIAGFSDVLATKVDGDDQLAEYAEKIQRTSKSAADLVQSVGDLVKTIETEEEPEPRPLQPIVRDAVHDVDAKFDDLTIELDLEDFNYHVYAGDLLDSLFTNVLSNAAVHNEDALTVRVYAQEPAPDRVVVGFADDGKGVADEVRDQIFEMGQKGPESDGTGLGLGFVRALTESYGGSVDVRESDRGGADFRVTLLRP